MKINTKYEVEGQIFDSIEQAKIHLLKINIFEEIKKVNSSLLEYSLCSEVIDAIIQQKDRIVLLLNGEDPNKPIPVNQEQILKDLVDAVKNSNKDLVHQDRIFINGPFYADTGSPIPPLTQVWCGTSGKTL